MHKNVLYHQRRGSVLVFALIILSLIMVATLGMARVTITEQQNAIVTKNSSVAFQNADAGIEEFLQQIYKTSNALDTLNSVAANMGMTCTGGSIKNTDGSFEIIAEKTVIVGGIESVQPVLDCDTTQLADIARFKVVGEYSDAARALQLKLKDGLRRGLVAHWSFEDNADAMSFDPNYPGSPTAKDYSQNNHILTLCPIDKDNHGLDGAAGFHDESFDYCHQYFGGDDSVLGDVNEDNSLADATWMDHGSDANNNDASARYRESSWGVQGSETGYNELSGIVDESASIPPHVAWFVPYGQALYFNGNSHYLTMNTSDAGRANYVSNDDALALTDALSISLWVKREKSGARQILLSRGDATRGYEVYIDTANRIRATVGGRTVNGGALDTNWHHVVITWGGAHDRRVRIYVDNTQRQSRHVGNSIANATQKFMIAGRYTRNNGSEPTFPNDLTDAFGGYVDDIRIYDRGLTITEIERLYNMQ